MWSQAMFLVVSKHDDMDMKLTEKETNQGSFPIFIPFSKWR